MKALVFVHDSNEVNRLFQFFTIAGDDSEKNIGFLNHSTHNVTISQQFYHDENLQEIRAKIFPDNVSSAEKERISKEDVYFINDVTTNDKRTAVVVRLCKHIEEGEKDKENENKERRPIPDNSIYMQIWGFDESKKTHWFALKILLTLRDSFADLIKSVNLQELIEERKVVMQRRALMINKALTHASGDVYNQFGKMSSGMRKVYNKECYKDDHKELYDIHLQMMADDIISSIYRKIVKGEDCFERQYDSDENNEQRNLERMSVDVFIDNIRQMFDVNWEPSSLDKADKSSDHRKFDYTLTRWGADSNGSKKLVIYFDFRNCKSNTDFFIWVDSWGRQVGVWLTLLMAINSIKHGSKNYDKYSLYVNVDDNEVVFSNPVFVNGDFDERNLKINQAIHIPPWLYTPGSEHLTLWTLYHASNPCGTDGGAGWRATFFVVDDNGNHQFRASFNVRKEPCENE